MTPQAQILNAIQERRRHQDESVGEKNFPPGEWLQVLVMQHGDIGYAVWHEDHQQYADSLLECAAACVAALESALRNQGVGIP